MHWLAMSLHCSSLNTNFQQYKWQPHNESEPLLVLCVTWCKKCPRHLMLSQRWHGPTPICTVWRKGQAMGSIPLATLAVPWRQQWLLWPHCTCGVTIFRFNWPGSNGQSHIISLGSFILFPLHLGTWKICHRSFFSLSKIWTLSQSKRHNEEANAIWMLPWMKSYGIQDGGGTQIVWDGDAAILDLTRFQETQKDSIWRKKMGWPVTSQGPFERVPWHPKAPWCTLGTPIFRVKM